MKQLHDAPSIARLGQMDECTKETYLPDVLVPFLACQANLDRFLHLASGDNDAGELAMSRCRHVDNVREIRRGNW